MILIFAHFYFPLVNGIAYSLKYWIGFTGIIPSFLCVQSLRHNKLYKVYVYFILTVFWNISTYVIALYFSAPNAGDGHIEEANEIIANTLNTIPLFFLARLTLAFFSIRSSLERS